MNKQEIKTKLTYLIAYAEQMTKSDDLITKYHGEHISLKLNEMYHNIE